MYYVKKWYAVVSWASPPSDQVVVHIQRPEDTPLNSHRRLIWCPFIQDDNEDSPEDGSQTLALLHEDRVWVFAHTSFRVKKKKKMYSLFLV